MLFRIFFAAAWAVLAASSTPAQAAGAASRPPGEAAGRSHFLVFPFVNGGSEPRLDWLGEGLEELTIERLTVSGQQVYSHDGRTAELERFGMPPSAKLSRASMLRLASDLDADFVLFGNFKTEGKNLSVEARLLRVNTPALLPALGETGPLESLMELSTKLIWRLLSAQDPGFPLRFSEFARLQRPLRLDAFEHFVRGRLAGEDDARLREFREAARLDPEWPDPVFALGQVYMSRRDCAAAVTWFGRVPRSHERFLDSVFSTGVCRLWLNQPDRAEETFVSLQGTLKTTSLAAGLPELWNNLAIARARSGKLTQAQADVARAAELDPDENDYPLNRGLLFLRADDAASAVSQFQLAARREPEDAEARALLIHALERAGQKKEAEAERAAAAEVLGATPLPAIRPDNLSRLERIRTELDTSGLWQEMDATAAATAPAAPANVTGVSNHVRMGRQFAAGGKLAEAEREFRVALAADERDPAAHRGLAGIFRRQQKLEEAAGEFRRSLELRDSATVRTELARVYLEQKKTELARQELQRALQLAPKYTAARELLQRLKPAKPGTPQ